MKFIKSYKIFESTNLELKQKLSSFDINHYILNEDGSIDCDQNVNLNSLDLIEIPFKFNKISGYFGLHHNKLTSLKNCAKYIAHDFHCHYNKLLSLEYGPEYVGYSYYCDHNQLTTLKGCIDEVYGYFNCCDNKLSSLEFCPMQVEGAFNCSNNQLAELDRSPFIRGNLYCYGMFKIEPKFNGSCENLIWV